VPAVVNTAVPAVGNTTDAAAVNTAEAAVVNTAEAAVVNIAIVNTTEAAVVNTTETAVAIGDAYSKPLVTSRVKVQVCGSKPGEETTLYQKARTSQYEDELRRQPCRFARSQLQE
jgi:hypothetical protein